jgi:DNA modification methylase
MDEPQKNKLYYGDNLEVLKKHIRDETVDLCYIDPPFNSKRNYNQIYTNVGKEDKALATAFIDTWTWDDMAIAGLSEIKNESHRFTTQAVDLISGLEKVLGKGSLLAYLISMTLRINEILRVLKPTGSFYLHCDPTASHYLKLICDALFCARSGDFRNEIIWCYRKWSVTQNQFVSNHDVILFYTKSGKNIFNTQYLPLSEGTVKRWKGKKQQAVFDESGKRLATNLSEESQGVPMYDWWEVSVINPAAKERLGYPTQKPEALLERIIKASSNEGDIVLDAYCGCGTTIAVAQKLNRNWIGIDITYQSISLILKRLEEQNKDALENVELNGIPKDFESAVALAHKKDDRVRKEFEKWLVLSYSNNKAIINDRKGGDKGIDGTAYIADKINNGEIENKKVIFQVKSNKTLTPSVVRELLGTVTTNDAACGILLTLFPFDNLVKACKEFGVYHNELTGNDYPKISVVSVNELFNGARMNLPNAAEVVKKAQAHKGEQKSLEDF